MNQQSTGTNLTTPTTVSSTTAPAGQHEKSTGEKIKEKIPGTKEHKAKKAAEKTTDTHGEQGRTFGTAAKDTFTKDEQGRSEGQAFKETRGTGTGAGTGTGHTVEEGIHRDTGHPIGSAQHLTYGSTIDTRGPGVGGSHGPPGAAEKIKESLPGTHEHKAKKVAENLAGTHAENGTLHTGVDTITTDRHGRPEARTDKEARKAENTGSTAGTTHTIGQV